MLKHLTTAILLLQSFVVLAQHNFKTYGLEEGLHQSQVYTIFEDSRGYLWVGTYGGGVSRYDGQTFENYNTSDGLSNNIIYAVAEDSSGNIWLGTDGGGACMFNGSEFTCIDTDNGLSNDHVFSIATGPYGRIWIGTNGGGITIYDPAAEATAQFSAIDTSSGLVSNNVHVITKDSHGNIWVGTEDGVNLLSINEINKTTPENFHAKATAFQWKTFVAETDEKGTSLKENRAAILSHNTVYSIIEDRNGNMLFGSYGGGITLLTKNGKTKHLTTENGLCEDEINMLYEDQSGNIWAGTYGSGVCKIINGVSAGSSQKFSHLNHEDGLSNNFVLSISGDHLGNIWLGTEGGGLVKYLGETFQHYTVEKGLKSNIVFSIIEDHAGNVLLGTQGGWITEIAIDDKQQLSFENFQTSRVLENEMIITLLEDQSGNVWVGTNNGLCTYDNTDESMTDMRVYEAVSPLNNIFILSSYEDRYGNLWFGTDGGGVVKFDPIDPENSFQTYNTDNGLAHNTVWSIMEDRGGNIWIGTWGGGVSRLTPKRDEPSTSYTVETITDQKGLSDNFVLSILEDHFGNLWFGTYGGGISLLVKEDILPHAEGSAVNISRLRKTTSKFQTKNREAEKLKWKYITTDDGLSDDGVVSLTLDAVGNIWAGTNKGINKISNIAQIATDESSVKIKTYGKREGFTGIECNQNAIQKDSHGSIWFGTANYLTRYNAWADAPNTTPPKTHITNIRLFFEDANWNNFADSVRPWGNLPVDLELPYNQNHLTFDFVGISLEIPEKVRYQYKLEGLDEKWSPPVKETFASYPQLPPGKYTFMVKACNDENVWNEQPTTFRFTITPPFWQTWWFYTLCVLSGILAIYGIILYRLRRLRKAKKLLEEQVKLRTKQLREEKALVEKQKSELEEAYHKLKELENFKQSMMGMIVHDLKNPLNSILSFSKYEPTKDILRNIYRAGKQMLNLVMNILDVQKFEDTKVSIKQETKQVLPLIGEAVSQVIHLAEQKEIRIHQKAGTEITAITDEEIITRVLVNLLTNAIKYTPTRGEITVNGEIDPKNENTVLFKVTDTGVGIPEEKLNTVFDRFTQVESKESGQVASTGLGLTFCKMAVEAHGGNIGVTSKENEGSTFFFTLPRGKNEALSAAEEAQIEAQKEDQKENLSLTKEDRELLSPLSAKFSEVTVYHTTENLDLLNEVREENERIQQWKSEMEAAVNNCNEEKYEQLLQMITSK